MLKILTIAAAATMIAGSAMADRVIERTVTGKNGESVTTTKTISRDGGTRSVTVDGSTSRGKTFSRQSSGTWDPATRTYTREGSGVTGAGRSWNSEGQTVCQNGVCTRQGSITGANGRTGTVNATTERLGRGVYRSEVTRTGPRGRSTTVNRTWRRVRGNN